MIISRAWEEEYENCWVSFLSDKFFCLKLELDLPYRFRNLNFGIHNRVAYLEPFKLSCLILSRVFQKVRGQLERMWRKPTGKVKKR